MGTKLKLDRYNPGHGRSRCIVRWRRIDVKAQAGGSRWSCVYLRSAVGYLCAKGRWRGAWPRRRAAPGRAPGRAPPPPGRAPARSPPCSRPCTRSPTPCRCSTPTPLAPPNQHNSSLHLHKNFYQLQKQETLFSYGAKWGTISPALTFRLVYCVYFQALDEPTYIAL